MEIKNFQKLEGWNPGYLGNSQNLSIDEFIETKYTYTSWLYHFNVERNLYVWIFVC